MSHNILNASAIETYVTSTNPKKITYTFRNDDGVDTEQTITLNQGFTGNIYFNPNSGKFQSIRNLVIELNSEKQFSKTQRFKFKYYAKVHYENNFSDSLMSVFNCPDGTNSFRIYYCNVEQLSQSQVINEIRQYPDNINPQYPYFYSTNTTNDIYYVIEIKGYIDNNNLINRTTINLTQPFFLIRNNGSSALTPLVQLNFYFTTIDVFKEEESVEEEVAEKELEGTTNIENQTPQNTTGGTSENQQTTSIIGTISSFVGAFSNISPSQNCQMVLPFPNFVGGNQLVDICQGKDKAPAIITIASSLLLIVTFVPVAFIVLSMIYREIRSFTNG